MDHRAIDAGRSHLGQRIVDRVRRDLAMVRAHLAVLPEVDLGIDDQHGPVVDEDALHHALTSGTIAAAGLDVMAEEPPKPDHPLFSLPNVTLTPHSAGPTWDNWTKAYRNGFDNIQRMEAGRAPSWVVPELRDITSSFGDGGA
ncbi:MAG: hypothetical protein HYU41_22310 [Candidatus Rokubacteria bacterium]|nr:hypothetical protein [Candidatus Rokubacteria bacterium]